MKILFSARFDNNNISDVIRVIKSGIVKWQDLLTKANIEKVLNDAYNQFKDVKEGANADYIKELLQLIRTSLELHCYH